MSDDALYTVVELVEALCRSEKVIYDWIKSGRLKSPGSKLILRSDGARLMVRAFRLSDAKSLLARDRMRPGMEDTLPPTMPVAPTYTRPGSPERIAVYQRRASKRQYVFHPQDEKIEYPAWMARIPVDERRSVER